MKGLNMWYYKTEKSLLQDILSEDGVFKSNSKLQDIYTDLLTNNKDGSYSLKINIAGYDKSEIEIYVKGEYIKIFAKNKELGVTEKSYKLIGLEPTSSEDVKVKLRNGLLYITIYDNSNKRNKKIPIHID